MGDTGAMKCKEVVERVTEYLEGRLPTPDRTRLEEHLAACTGCSTYLGQTRQTVGALAGLKDDAVSQNEREKLLDLFRGLHSGQEMAGKQIPLGICEGCASAGDHIAYFWESERDFERGVAFLEAGLRAGDANFVFGYDAANEKVLGTLKNHEFEIGQLQRAGKLHVLSGAPSGDEMLESIGAAFQKAMAGGAKTLRLLGNIGWGKPGWPEEDNILEFEAKVTAAARNFPCLIVCMYDVRALAGRIIFKGGFETHPLAIHESSLRENPYHVAMEPFLAQLRKENRSELVQ